MRDLERGADAPDQHDRSGAHDLHHDEEDRQQVDEPERAERLDQRQQIEAHDLAGAVGGHEARRLEHELDRHPEQIEISEVHDLAVEILPPRPVDHLHQEQA